VPGTTNKSKINRQFDTKFAHQAPESVVLPEPSQPPGRGNLFRLLSIVGATPPIVLSPLLRVCFFNKVATDFIVRLSYFLAHCTAFRAGTLLDFETKSGRIFPLAVAWETLEQLGHHVRLFPHFRAGLRTRSGLSSARLSRFKNVSRTFVS